MATATAASRALSTLLYVSGLGAVAAAHPPAKSLRTCCRHREESTVHRPAGAARPRVADGAGQWSWCHWVCSMGGSGAQHHLPMGLCYVLGTPRISSNAKVTMPLPVGLMAATRGHP